VKRVLQRRSPFDLTRAATGVATLLALAAIVAILFFLAIGSVPVLRQEGLAFFLRNHWAYRSGVFEAVAMIYGSAVVSTIALLLATPVAITAALFMSEIASERVRIMLKFLIELLAGVPSVVYGLLGVLILRNWMLAAFERLELDAYSGDTLLTAGVLLAVMILPTLTTLADDGFRSVGSAYRDAARGLGLTRAESAVFVVARQALPALIGAVLLALGRALGETVAVFLVVGRADNRFPAPGELLTSLIDAGQTITSKLGGAETSIAVGDELHMSALLALGLVLLITVVSLTLAADLLRSRLMRSRA
jgi:phosphate transport system permease protein